MIFTTKRFFSSRSVCSAVHKISTRNRSDRYLKMQKSGQTDGRYCFLSHGTNQRLLSCILKLLIFLCAFLFSFNSIAQNQPNILVFIADDAGMDFGCYGNPGIKTPNIDQLAADGMRFDNMFLTTSQCSPSRTSMLSGMFPHTIGTEDLHNPLPDSVKIVPGYLSEAGYYTGVMLKTHIGKAGEAQFDWYDKGFWPDYVQGRWFDKALGNFQTFLDNAEDKPFFMWMGFVDPHRAYGEREEVPENRAPKVNDPAKTVVPPYLVDDPATREDLALYYDEITRMDSQIGEFMAELEKRDLAENTIVIFLSDNGFPFPRGKATVYDSGIKTPFVVKWPGKVKQGSSYGGLGSTIDLAPTLLEMAGIEKPGQMYGKSFVPQLQNPSLPGRDLVFGERNWHNTDEHIRCVRSENYKLIVNAYIELPPGLTGDYYKSPAWHSLRDGHTAGTLKDHQKQLFQAPRHKVELYDVKNDPHELVNLADSSAHLKEAEPLVKALKKWMDETNDYPPNQRRRMDDIDRISAFPLYNMYGREYYDD